MKNTNVLALALAVLPAAVSATTTETASAKYCFVQYTCYKSDMTSAAITADTTNGGAGTASITKCGGDTNAATSYVGTDGLFAATGTGADAAAGKGAAPCVAVLKGDDAAKKTGSEFSEKDIVGVVGEVFTDPLCSKKVLTATGTKATLTTTNYPGLAPLDTSATNGGKFVDANGYTAAEFQTAVSDKWIALTAAGQIAAASDGFPHLHDIGTGMDGTTGMPKFPFKVTGHDYVGIETGTTKTTRDATGTAGCMNFGSTLQATINTANNAKNLASVAGNTQFAPYVASNPTTYNQATTDALTHAPTGLSVHCAKADGVLTIQYHKGADCSTNHDGWQPQNASSTGALSCLPAKHIRGATCEGVDTCTTTVATALKHIITESADKDKACGTSVENSKAAATTDPTTNKACTKACLCPTGAEGLSHVTNKTGACFEPYTKQAGVLAFDLSADLTGAGTTVKAGKLPAADGKNGVNQVLVHKTFDLADGLMANTLQAAVTLNSSKCGDIAIAAAATSPTAAQTALLAASKGADSLWSATGCGFVAAKEPTGAHSVYAMTFASTVAALLGAALF